MDAYHRAITICRWAGIAPVTRKHIDNEIKGDDYTIPIRTLIFSIIQQIITLYWMVVQFRSFVQLQPYTTRKKMFQVEVIMYFEVFQCVAVVVFSFIFRFPNLEALLRKCKIVLTDLNKENVPFFARNFGIIGVLLNTLFVIYRAKDSLREKKMMLPFWVGMSKVILLKSLLLLLLSIVKTSYKKINKDLSEILAKPYRNSKHLQLVVFQLNVQHQKASNLLVSILSDFGPDVLSMCLFFLFKISIIVYHLYLTLGKSVWGNNVLMGEITGFIQILQLVVNMGLIVYVSDTLFEEKRETRILLLTLMKNTSDRWNSDLINTIKTFILQVQCEPNGFNVCGHFMFTRALLYDMLWGALTYLFVFIQFQDLKS